MMRFFKFFIIIAALLISCRVPAETAYKDFAPFKMIFLPDVYLSFSENESDSAILYKESLVIFQDVIKELNQRDDINFAVFGGNLTNNDDGELSDLPMFLDIASDLKFPYYAVLGNREADLSEGFTKDNFAKEFDEFNYETLKQTFWTAEPAENVLLIGLDTSINGEETGYVNIHQIFWLDNVLKNNRDKFTIIAMHHSPYLSLEKPDLFLELLNYYPQVKVILSGHDRISFVKKENGKLFISCPSIVSYPNQYKILEIYPDKVEVDTEKISFKQIIKKAKKKIGKDYRKPDKFSRKRKFNF